MGVSEGLIGFTVNTDATGGTILGCGRKLAELGSMSEPASCVYSRLLLPGSFLDLSQ